ncbi:MAG: hypothetical protein GY870_09465, partial [archaeon]|nr:hypothetical protein [archaeon]
MKLYKWYKDKVESVEVIKETPKMYTIKSHKIAFGYRTKIYKEGTFHTEKEALEEKQYELLERIKKIKI